jgi:hypothetical protein
MTLALFLFGIIIIAVISRYNESNKLFWSLLVAYLLSFSVGKLYINCSNKEKSDVQLTQAYPTQGLVATSGTFAFLLADVMPTTVVKETSKPVSKVNTPDYCEPIVTLSVCGVTHEQYLHILPNPPNGVTFFDSS